jgi:hypothetical protein
MPETRPKIPAAFGYALFSGTATMLAFLLPLASWAIVIKNRSLPGLLQPVTIDILLASCLYHGYYRAKTLAADLGATGKKLAAWQLVFKIALCLGLLMLAVINIFLLHPWV